MRDMRDRAMPDLGRVSDTDMLSGRLGVFASNWVEARKQPESTGNYLVAVGVYEPVIGRYVAGVGWNLAETPHAGLEKLIGHWMELPEGPR